MVTCKEMKNRKVLVERLEERRNPVKPGPRAGGNIQMDL
jgi:hypothetical protein